MKFEQLQAHMSELRAGPNMSSIGSEAQIQLRGLLSLSEDVCQVISQQRILKGLAFEDMHGSEDEWSSEDESEADSENGTGDSSEGANDFSNNKDPASIEIDEQSSIEESDEEYSGRAVIRDRDSQELGLGGRRDSICSKPFVDWLASGNRFFHVCGKLGSGKSTLMKFLCDHKRTQEELEKWAGDDRKLVFAKFFFWRPGSMLQRSISGLLRSLLHDTLKVCPDLISAVLPDQWNNVKSIPWQMQHEPEFGNQETRSAFTRLIENRNMTRHHRFCFFIDGLDEYEETRQEDYKDLLDLLSKWTEAAPDDVKLCVSSREDNVFVNNFSSEQRIRLQDLTKMIYITLFERGWQLPPPKNTTTW
ncbi:uncharacterized protein LY89DRAFT_667608 [Mollisia scopiformis]|uniref:Nephrocystin 3-like N-terminal domain-containing protein n=1 Tax=Mollisia scopiformis TaxID=149040 RepID=A0A194XEB5_MOLSC|nr:uncharacterized protein LY89DRAFT_667608 [Mollisia scopiformis]KUJ18518.1 hypothetical protein LY89DRAFT_667608 [Mollisia scopiformis]